MSLSKYELVETNSGWHARFRGENAEVIWWTETYTTKENALDAIRLLKKATHYDGRVIATAYSEEVQIIEVTETDEYDWDPDPLRAPEPELPPPGQTP
jgi:uncharacterized protein YegP (UPF0339 family)